MKKKLEPIYSFNELKLNTNPWKELKAFVFDSAITKAADMLQRHLLSSSITHATINQKHNGRP